jgi:hypothetical protein
MEIILLVILLISIYILYLTIKFKYTVCPSEMKTLISTKPKEPVKVSEIFGSMFRDSAVIPGTVQLADGTRI